MTEEQLEREIQRRSDSLDTQLINRTLSQDEYNQQMRKLDCWAENQRCRLELAKE